MYNSYSSNQDNMNLIEKKPPSGSKTIPKSGCLFLGDISSAKDVANLESKHIRCVLSAIEHEQAEFDDYENITHLVLPCEDRCGQDISQHFEEAIEFIEENLKVSNVLVHCYAGVSRSSTLVLCYLINSHKWSFWKAFSFLKTKRSIVFPNYGF